MGQLLAIVTHPAFRLGFLDAQDGRPFDHDRIVARIEAETPRPALERLGWFSFGRFDQAPDMFAGAGMSKLDRDQARAALAQYRYEEGRMMVVGFGVRCRSWGHPDFPPAAVTRLLERLSAERRYPMGYNPAIYQTVAERDGDG